MYDIQNPNHELRTSPEIILKNGWKIPKYNEAAKDVGLISTRDKTWRGVPTSPLEIK